ncbi:MAG: sigma-54 dependent transcriptional regulator [Gammaproteobacteria bacterium]|nr:sigma-54 dependent transcriptional regulator [Gammaproteobacteria bacterium]NNF60346.1 sigma-54-dependent Fis family transcriptional regulator [Gammaproteobacteria bacterium]NNM20610.1 sigma-54-dependent Fis family transcriptional regulator [Gammaproteobacteria bacterium]
MSAAHILVVDDEADIRELLEEILREEGYTVSIAADAAAARERRKQHEPDLVLLDIWMPDTDGITLLREWAESGNPSNVVMMSGHGTVETAVEATRLGALDFIEKPVSLAKLLKTVERALTRQPRKVSRGIVPKMVAPLGKSQVMQDLREQIKRIAGHDSNVLLVGEVGTGREAFARFLHSLSDRAGEPMVTVVAGSLTEDNAEELLFGSIKDGDSKPGYLEQARGGTLFLNEIEDLPPHAQTLLLSALESGGYRQHGSSDVTPLEVRIITSSGTGVESSMQRGKLRRDLLAHLNVIRLRIPPLRDYSEDVPDLLRYYVDKLVDKQGLPLRRFSVAAQNRLRNYPWPGNINDLKNMVHRLLVLGGAEDISLAEVEQALEVESAPAESLVKQDLLALPLREAREQFERAYLQQQLDICGGKVGLLAKRVGMERTHLYRKLRSLGVEFGSSSAADD